MATEVGVGYVRLIPTARGFGAEASRALGGPMRQAARQVGQEAGDELTRSIGERMTSAGGTLTAAVTAPLAGISTAALMTAADFESGMNAVRAVTGATGQDFEALSDLAKEMGSSTQFSATEAAAAMEYLGMAGWDTEQIMSGVGDVLSLAAAGGMDLAEAADIASNVMSGFGIEAEDSARVADVLASTVASANTDITQLGEAMKYAAPLASAAGWSMEETAAAIGFLGNAGIQGSMAGTGLNSVLATLADTSSTGGRALEAFGVAAQDSNGEVRPLVDVLDDLADQGADVSDVIEIFGLEAGPKLQALLGQGSDGIRELIADLEDSEGAAQEMADIRMDGFSGSLAELKSAWEGLMIAVAESGLLEWATAAVQRITGFVQALSQTNPALLQMATVAAAVAAAAGPALWVAGQLAGSLTAISGAAPLVSGALAALVSPLGLVVAAVAALGAGLVIAYQQSDTFREIVGSAADVVTTALGGLLEVAGRVREAFGEGGLSAALTEAREALTEWGAGAVEAAQHFIGGLVEGIADHGPQIIETVLAMREAVLDSALTLFEGIVDALPVIIPMLVGAVTSMITQLVTAIITAAPLVISGAVQLLMGLVDAAIVVLPLLIQAAMDLVSALVVALADALPLILTAGVALFTGLLDGAVEVMPDLLAFISGVLIPTLAQTVVDLLPVIIEAGIGLLLALLDGLIEALPMLAGFVGGDLIPTMVSAIVGLLPVILQAGVDLLLALLTGLAQALPRIVAFAADLIPIMVRTITGLLPQIITSGIALIGALATGLLRALPQIARTITSSVIPAIARALRTAVSRMASIGWDLMRSLARGIRDGARSVVQSALNFVTRMIPSWKGPQPVDLRLLVGPGEDIMTGLVAGIEQSVPRVRGALAGVTAAMPAMAGLPAGVAHTSHGPGSAVAPAQLVLRPDGSRAARALMEVISQSVRTQYGGDVTRLGRG